MEFRDRTTIWPPEIPVQPCKVGSVAMYKELSDTIRGNRPISFWVCSSSQPAYVGECTFKIAINCQLQYCISHSEKLWAGPHSVFESVQASELCMRTCVIDLNCRSMLELDRPLRCINTSMLTFQKSPSMLSENFPFLAWLGCWIDRSPFHCHCAHMQASRRPGWRHW